MKLVCESKESMGTAGAASFKHVSPAGVALGVNYADEEIYFLGTTKEKLEKYSPVALAYIRARNCDLNHHLVIL